MYFTKQHTSTIAGDVTNISHAGDVTSFCHFDFDPKAPARVQPHPSSGRERDGNGILHPFITHHDFQISPFFHVHSDSTLQATQTPSTHFKMSSANNATVEIAVPVGTINEWCIYALSGFHGETHTCANETRGTNEDDFQTICCDGFIIDSTQDLYKYNPTADRSETHVDLANLVCCAAHGSQQGGIQPIIQGNGMTCTTGSPTPLSNLAATDTNNAANYLATYTGAQGGSQSGTYNPTLEDFIPTETPYCLWMDTVGLQMQSITVAAADITTPPAATTDEFGYPITTGTFAPSTTSRYSYTTASAATTSSSSSSALPIAVQSSWLGLLSILIMIPGFA